MRCLTLCFLLTVVNVACCRPVQAAPDKPLALVYEHYDQWTDSSQASELLQAAGFDVLPLPLDQSPFNSSADLIVLGSFCSEDPGYADYMASYGADLYNYVDHGHLLLQFTQADQFEEKPPFLPTTQGARRCDNDYSLGYILSPGHTLMQGLPLTDGKVSFSEDRTIWEAFAFQSGFEVLLATDEDAQYPAVMEGAYGQGRILLAAMALDKANLGHATDPVQEEHFEDFRRRFFANLYQHTLDVNALSTAPLAITPSPRTVEDHVPGSWNLAVLPDTQVYSLRYPGEYLAQTAWIVNNAERLDIRYVLHEGDIVNNNTAAEWFNAREAHRLLDGRVPYIMAPGNHDYGPSGDASTRDTLFNDYFEFELAAALPGFGGAYEQGRLDNTWHSFSAAGTDWLILALEWAPRDEVVDWACQVLEAHPAHRGMLVTHSFMYNDDTRTDHTKPAGTENYNPHDYRTPGSINDGQQLWDKLVRSHDVPLVLSGHILGDGSGYRVDLNDAGTPVHQMLANYQMRELGGECYLRLLEFRPDGSVQVRSYSPLYDSYLLTPDQQFSLELK
ncbi:metallophosphoesterase [bacterium]|nr:metallophosphoesterase [bacterium]